MTGIRINSTVYNVSEQFANGFKNAVETGASANTITKGEATTIAGTVQPSTPNATNQDAAALEAINSELGKNSSLMVDTNTADGIAPVLVKFKKPTSVSFDTNITSSNSERTPITNGGTAQPTTNATGFTDVYGAVQINTGNGLTIDLSASNLSGTRDQTDVNSTRFSAGITNDTDFQRQQRQASEARIRANGF